MDFYDVHDSTIRMQQRKHRPKRRGAKWVEMNTTHTIAAADKLTHTLPQPPKWERKIKK